MKACLIAALGEAPRTHNVGGEFGRHFRGKVGPDVTRRVNRILADYDAPRYPEWAVPPVEVIEGDLEFVENLVSDVVPRLLGGLP